MSTNKAPEILHEHQITPRQWLIIVLCLLASMIEGFDIVVISYTAPAISQEWGVSAEQMGDILSAGVLGMTLGAMFLSWMADRYGRRIMVSSTLIIAGLATSAVWLSSNTWQLVALRTGAGLALGVLVASLAPLVGEFSPKNHRILIVSVLVAAASGGAMGGAFVTAAIIETQGWQAIFLYAGLLTVVLGVLIQWLVPESIAFTIKRHPGQALERVNRILSKIGQATVEQLPPTDPQAQDEPAAVQSLLTKPRLRATLLIWCAFFTGFVVVYFVTSWMPKVLTDAGLSQQRAIQATATIPMGSIFGTMIMGAIARWYSLNKLIAGSFVLGAAAILFLGFYASDLSQIPFALVLGLLLVIGLSLMAGFSNLYNMVLTIYPAQIRSTGLGWAAGLGRAGAVISPMLAGVFLGMGTSLPLLFLLFALPAFIAAICTLCIAMEELP